MHRDRGDRNARRSPFPNLAPAQQGALAVKPRRDHSCTIDELHAALDRHPIQLDRDAYLKPTLALELIRLDELEEAFREKALVGSGRRERHITR
jgi:hypothetical protein